MSIFVENKIFRNNMSKLPNDLAREIELEFVESHPILFRNQIENALFNRDKWEGR